MPFVQVKDPDTGIVRPCQVAKKWVRRRAQEPYRRGDYRDPATAVIKGLEHVKEADRGDNDFPYFEVNNPEWDTRDGPAPQPKILGVWATGSGVAGMYNQDSDIDIWVKMQGLTHQGEKYVDQDVIAYIRGNDERGGVGYAAGRERKVDNIVLDYGPGDTTESKGFCTYDLLEDGTVREEVDRFNGVERRSTVTPEERERLRKWLNDQA